MTQGDTWKPAAATDAKVREWMSAQGLAVSSTKNYFDEEVYAWRNDQSSGSPTLWVTRAVLDQYDPEVLVAQLSQLGVADRMRSNPKARFLIVEEDGKLRLVVWGHSSEERGRRGVSE